MRVTSELFVSALVRRAFAAGGFAAIVNRGAAEAGAVFVVARGSGGAATLFGPASQTAYVEDGPADRLFSVLVEGGDADIEKRIEKERRFDPDIWVLEIEMAPQQVLELVRLARS